MWEDDRLKWSPIDYDNVTEITLPLSEIWVS